MMHDFPITDLTKTAKLNRIKRHYFWISKCHVTSKNLNILDYSIFSEMKFDSGASLLISKLLIEESWPEKLFSLTFNMNFMTA